MPSTKKQGSGDDDDDDEEEDGEGFRYLVCSKCGHTIKLTAQHKKAVLCSKCGARMIKSKTSGKGKSKEEPAVMTEKAPQRGQGQGRRQGRQGAGGWKYCVCPKCGYTVEHTRGKPCLKTTCAKCRARMMGSNTKGKLAPKEFAENVSEICREIRGGE